MKNKKIIIISAVILLIAALIVIGLDNYWFSKNKSFNKASSNAVYPTAVSQEYWSDIIPKKKIVPVFMNDKDKEALNISTSTKVNPEKIQILKRDASGKILEYKLIHTDADLVTSE
jgi:flagellar basal body-associated protein FliL